MQFKAFRLAPLLALMMLLALRPFAWAGDGLIVLDEEFDGDSLSAERWPFRTGTIVVSGGLLRHTYGELKSSAKALYCTWSFKIKLNQTDKTVWIKLDGSGCIRVTFGSSGVIVAHTEIYGQGWRDSSMGSYEALKWYVIKVVWEKGRVRYYVNDTLKAVHTDKVPEKPLMVYIDTHLASGATIWLDWMRVEVDAEKVYDRPSVVFWKGADVPREEWDGSKLNLTVYHPAYMADKIRVYIPRAYRSYICEVYRGSTKLNTIKFSRLNRTLTIYDILSAPSGKVHILLVDPEPWMVQLYYSLLPLGIDIGVLLRWYDRLKKRHPALPWLLLIIFIILVIFVGYLAYRLLTEVRT